MRVMDVAAGGPAADAGLRIGDVLTSIGGRSLKARTLSDVRRELKLLPVGEPIAFGYLRDGQGAEARLVPRHLIPE